MQLYRVLSVATLTLSLLGAAMGQAAKTQPAKKGNTKMENPKNPVVVMKTSSGSVTIELFEDKAPVTVKNFLSYVDEKYYDSTVFHRVIKNFMIQGGGFQAGSPMRQKSTKPPIVNEAKNGLKNDRGTIAMARINDPNSATSQFFINVVDNPALNAGGYDPNGYAVFGKVLEGMDVVDKIREVKTGKAEVIALNLGSEVKTTFQDVPQETALIESIRRLEKK